MIRFHPLAGFGIEAEGVDLAKPLADADFRALEQAFYAHHLLALRAQEIDAAQFLAFARRIGPPQPHVIDQFHHPDDPNILILSNVKKDGKPTGLQDAGSYFHTDYSYLQVPARATTLYSRVVPKVGGDTLFADQQAAYDDLPEAMKRRIEPLLAIHHYGNRHDVDEASRTAASVLSAEQKAKMPVITHRIARPHPVTGRKALYAVSGSSFGIVGMPDDEARDLLDELAAHSTAPRYQLRFRYGVGDIVVWDNAALLHSATLTDPDDARTLWRITVLEESKAAAAPAVLAPTFATPGNAEGAAARLAQQPVDALAEHPRPARLRQEGVVAVEDRADDGFVHARVHRDPRGAGLRVAAQRATERQPVHARHVDVEDHGIEALVAGRLQRRVAAVDRLDAVAQRLQRCRHQDPHLRGVVDGQDPSAGRGDRLHRRELSDARRVRKARSERPIGLRRGLPKNEATGRIGEPAGAVRKLARRLFTSLSTPAVETNFFSRLSRRSAARSRQSRCRTRRRRRSAPAPRP